MNLQLPSYTVNDKSFRPAEAMMMPVVSWQMAVPSNDECGISKFSYKNYDYVLPFTWTEVISTDVMVSTLLNVLTVQLATPIPPIIAIVMDNGSSGKSVGTIRVPFFVQCLCLFVFIVLFEGSGDGFGEAHTSS